MKGRQIAFTGIADQPLQFRKFEEQGYARGFKCVAGVDEVGRGPLAGPVVAAAVILPRGFFHPEIKDSKLLTPKQREKLAPLIRKNALSWGLGVVEVEDIDRINILKASLLAMLRALEGLTSRPDCVLIDGNQRIPKKFLSESSCFVSCSLYQKTIISGDQLCISIAAASLIAKVARDRMLVRLDKRYPEYGFAVHKGYATPHHLAAIAEHGPCPVHRRSFAPFRPTQAELF